MRLARSVSAPTAAITSAPKVESSDPRTRLRVGIFGSRGRPKLKGPIWTRVKGAAAVEPEKFISSEVDPILDKIARQGMGSLTRRERKILEAAKDKIDKRR